MQSVPLWETELPVSSDNGVAAAQQDAALWVKPAL